MPNWVTNKMEIAGTEKQVEKVLKYIKSEEYDSPIDFNCIVPAPECIRKCPSSGREAKTAENFYKIATKAGIDPIAQIKAGKLTSEMREQQKDWEEFRQNTLKDKEQKDFWGERYLMPYIDLMVNYLTCMKETGCVDWYDWDCENWGTKWNATEATVDGNMVTFWTAWSAPEPIFKALANRFKTVTFRVECANEDYALPVALIEYRYDRKQKQVTKTLLGSYYREYEEEE